MTLDEYMDAEKVTLADLAKLTGVSTGSLSRIARGLQNVTLDAAMAIVEATGGKVTLDDLALPRSAPQVAA